MEKLSHKYNKWTGDTAQLIVSAWHTQSPGFSLQHCIKETAAHSCNPSIPEVELRSSRPAWAT